MRVKTRRKIKTREKQESRGDGRKKEKQER